LISIAVFVLLVAALGYLFGWLTGKYLKWDRDVIVTLTFNGGMRNISAGTVLAITYFPAPVAVPVVIGMLFQQFLATSYGHMLHRYYGTGENLKEYVSKENELRDSSIAQ
jgi:predicted Na+-dependent transporter